jgi:hypothetical protein
MYSSFWHICVLASFKIINFVVFALVSVKKRGKIQGHFSQYHEYVTLNLFHFEKKLHNDKYNTHHMLWCDEQVTSCFIITTTKLIILNDASTHICVIRYTSHNFNDNCLGNLTLLTETEKKYTANITWGTHRISKELHYSFSYPISSWPCIVTTVVRINIRSLAGSFSAFHQD